MQTDTAVQTDSILAKLKQRTAHQHQQTENGVDLMRDDFSLADYRKLLIRFYAFYQSFEAKMRRAIADTAVAFNYAERLNAPRLRDDLKTLGMSDEDIAAIAPVKDLPALDSAEKVFGALYVVEGSTLGGQIIARHLKEKFNLDETHGAAFFSGYGKDTGKMWNTFREAITKFAAHSHDQEEIIKSANQTFEEIGKSLSAS